MELKEYFETTSGKGVLASADTKGQVDAAIQSRPQLSEPGVFHEVSNAAVEVNAYPGNH